MTEITLEPPTPSASWAPKTGAVASPVDGYDTDIAWSADRGWMSSEYAGAPDNPPPDAEGVTVVLPVEA